MLCTFCGTENRPENKFCGMCGVKLERRKVERRVRHGAASLKCASCGNVIEAGNTFCGMCGARVERRISERRAGQGRASAIANVQLPTPEVLEASEPAAKPQAELKPDVAVEPNPELLAPPPAEDTLPRPHAAIFRSSSGNGKPAQPSTISGPSFLGLSDGSGSSGDYLLEEEKSSGGMVRTLVFLTVLVALVGLAAFEWRSSLRASQRAPEPSRAAPAASPSPEEKPGAETPGPQETKSPDAAAEATPAAVITNASDQRSEDQADPAQPSPAAPPDLPAEKSKAGETSARGAKSGSRKENAREEPQPVKPSAALVKAQDYLQGRNGVKQDCDQGLAYLRVAVQKNEPAAAMQMGELYANGRCVQQDRVAAYRWMNSAREKAPGNPAIQASVDQLWGRMTPQERKDAGH